MVIPVYEVSEYASNMLTVEIREAAGGRDQTVAAVSLHSDQLKNTLHFSGRRSIADVFHPDFADYLQNLIARAIDAPMVLTDPDVIQSFGGAVVARMRMLVNKAMDGGRHITVRCDRHGRLNRFGNFLEAGAGFSVLYCRMAAVSPVYLMLRWARTPAFQNMLVSCGWHY